MEYVILLNGDKPENIESDFYVGKTVICADGAYNYAKKLNIKVDLLIGDFDSLKKKPKSIKTITYDSDKDYTDGELALDRAIENGAENITILGASGKRDDHWYANIMLLYKALTLGVKASIKTNYCDIYMFNSDFSLDVKKGVYFSIVPFNGNLHIMNTEGLKYSIVDKTLHQFQTLGISNITTGGTIKIKVKSGCGIAFATFENAHKYL